MNTSAAHSKIIAEVGVNHDGHLEKAKRLVDASKAAGADAVKFQSFTAAELASEQAELAEYQKKGTDQGSQRDMLGQLEFGPQEFETLIEYCATRDIEFMSTAFDKAWLDFLVGSGIQSIKWPSGELTNHQFLEQGAETGLPILLSTGMATLDEVAQAVDLVRRVWKQRHGSQRHAELTVMHCTSLYPAPPDTLNLSALRTLAQELDVAVGYSDHSEGVLAGPVCVAFGATVFEKHITYDKRAEGPDHSASLEPEEFARYVDAIRWAEDALGTGEKKPHVLEGNTAEVARKSVFAGKEIAAGEVLTAEMLVLRRPGNGIQANHLPSLIGRRLVRTLTEGQKLSWADLE